MTLSIWDDEFLMNEAYAEAQKSNDISTQVGACLVGPKNDIRAKGYNGPVRGEDENDPNLRIAPYKGQRIEHAERNVFYHCARYGIACAGCRLYCTWPPCVECARAIKQCGIIEVVYHREAPVDEKWRDSFNAGADLLNRTNVKIRTWSGIPAIRALRLNGIVHNFYDNIPTNNLPFTPILGQSFPTLV